MQRRSILFYCERQRTSTRTVPLAPCPSVPSAIRKFTLVGRMFSFYFGIYAFDSFLAVCSYFNCSHRQIFGLIRKFKNAASQSSGLKYFHRSGTYFCDFLFFAAERKTSLGKDWHSFCLKCEKCKKVLQPGGHAEHEGKPYCNQPCYSSLFGPGGTSRYFFYHIKTLDLIAFIMVHSYQTK